MPYAEDNTSIFGEFEQVIENVIENIFGKFGKK